MRPAPEAPTVCQQKKEDGQEMTTITRVRPQAGVTDGDELRQPSVEDLARRRLVEQCPYAFCFDQITFNCSKGVLTLRGRLPSFYLKQMLQTLLRNLDGVTRIDNQVDVVSSIGLSSVRPK
jgi:hypothetical protein